MGKEITTTPGGASYEYEEPFWGTSGTIEEPSATELLGRVLARLERITGAAEAEARSLWDTVEVERRIGAHQRAMRVGAERKVDELGAKIPARAAEDQQTLEMIANRWEHAKIGSVMAAPEAILRDVRFLLQHIPKAQTP